MKIILAVLFFIVGGSGLSWAGCNPCICGPGGGSPPLPPGSCGKQSQRSLSFSQWSSSRYGMEEKNIAMVTKNVIHSAGGITH
jgi:hypothetical protein